MSSLGCTCGYTIRDQTDFLPYKAHIREDEDTQKPMELLRDVLAQLWEVRDQGRQAEVIREFYMRIGVRASIADRCANQLEGSSLPDVLASVVDFFWNHYDRVIYECEECGRLWVQTEVNRFASYLPETDTRHVLWSRHNHNPYGDLRR